MSKTYLPYDPDQQLLLPAALREWLPDDHLAYFISDVVDQLDLSSITARYEGERRGGPPYHPRMMVKVLLYGYCIGVASSRRIAQRLHEDIAFRVLAANNTPDFRTISDFRKDHLGALAGLFLQVLAFCQRAGLVKLGHVALDGTHQTPGRGPVGEDTHHVCTPTDLLVQPFQWILGPELLPMRHWEGGEGQGVGQGILQHLGSLGEVFPELSYPPSPPGREPPPVRAGVDGAHHGGYSGVGPLGHSGQQVGHEVGSAALPTRTGKHRGDGLLQPVVGIGDDQLTPL